MRGDRRWPLAAALLACSCAGAEVPVDPTALPRREIEAAWLQERLAAASYELAARRAVADATPRDALEAIGRLAVWNAAELSRAEAERGRVATAAGAARLDARVAAHRQVAEGLGLLREEIQRRVRCRPAASAEALAPWDEPRGERR